ncbi:hypothetical protein PHLGIDRAFT_123225 [Phlebiopsis gigantea 11061_1 CR5-6]|uniref:F-box domain-containing protein n=1 Tax=Phlebiopsis gigantea (strain 11061_1 CR5-6) TaxID=745531 RepID=A0A0C3S205_PHLG1|nr:hypothetical protein PHLGIDRAFT_123225 [Phlebiopsis gigantea 11061_1 CR5-6]
MRRTIPTEVCERIIDYVGGEHAYIDVYVALHDVTLMYETIHACSLTCKAWLHRSRRHLFRFLGVSCQQEGPRNLNSLHALLVKEAYLQPLVHALLVSSTADRASSMHAAAIRTPRLLPGVRVLRFSRGALYVPRGVELAMRQFASVVDLYLNEVSLYTVHDLRRTLCALRHLKGFMLQSPAWHTSSAAVAPPSYPRAPPSLRLSRLNVEAYSDWLRDARSVYFIEWLARSGAAGSLCEVLLTDMMVTNPPMMSAVQSVLEACHDSLVWLGLSWSPGTDVDIRPLASAVSTCAKLERVRLRIPHKARCVSDMAHLLSTCESKIWMVSVWFIEHQVHPPVLQPDEIDFAALDSVFQSPRWKALQRFVVHYYGLAAEKSWEDESGLVPVEASAERRRAELRRLLPRTYKLGVLYYS